VHPSIPLYFVQDTTAALGSLAARQRTMIRVPVIGITGTAGKTTTLELTRGALSGARRVHATVGGRNGLAGMSMALLATPADAEAVVLEMGTDRHGGIATLARIARPDIGVVTTVGEAHLDGLDSFDGVLREKLDLLRNLAPGGRGVVGDEPESLPAAALAVCSTIDVVGWSHRAGRPLPSGDVTVDATGACCFPWRDQRVRMSIPGRHAAMDALLALRVAELLGVPPGAAVAGVEGVRACPMRGEVRRVGGLTVVLDCYNANPPSVRAALDLLAARAGARKVAVLGSMLELGAASAALHAKVLADALSHRFDLVVATGAFAGAASAVRDPGLVKAADWPSAYPALRERLLGNEVILLKASRSIALEGILSVLEADFGGSQAGESLQVD
jgi:UDP-N-acetylmuramoyl-tripeptide--D-alanyl-D-alanine ligase